MDYKHKNATYKTAGEYIKNRESFHNNHETFSGYPIDEKPARFGTGDLNEETAHLFNQMLAHYDIDYIVYSYVTPVAWFSPNEGWYEVSQKFSQTTTKQMSTIRRAVDIAHTI